MAFARGALTRRELLRRAGLAGGMFAGAGLLAACGSSSGGWLRWCRVELRRRSSIDKTVASSWTFSNWPLYIDTEKKTHHPSLELFDKKYNTKTNYLEDIEDNESFFGKVQGAARGRPGHRARHRHADRLDGRASGLRWATGEARQVAAPQRRQNQSSALRGRPIDPKDDHLVPWQSGMTGIAYNPKLTGGELTSVADLWNPEFKGKVDAA